MSTLTTLLSSRVKAEVFRLLFGPAEQELHVRELARRSRLSESTVRQELRRLTGLGLLAVRRDSNRAYYRADARHPLYADIRSMVVKTDGLVEVLRTALDSPEIRFAFVFGSVAAGTEKPDSDVDLMVIGTPSLRRVSTLLLGISERVGREINPHVMTWEELCRRSQTRDHFIASVMGSPRLMVIGDESELEGLGR